jgi:phosphomannomutase
VTLIKSISGIRGTIGGKAGEALTPLDIVKFASAYSAWMLAQGTNKKVVLGRDARLSGEMLTKLVSATLQGMGIEVIDLGLSTTPTVEIAVTAENAGGGIILTASHNPGQWNALKLLNHKGEFISEADGQWILQYAESQDFNYATVSNLGTYKQDNSYMQKHIAMILELPLVDKEAIKNRKFKIIVDAVNSSGGIAVPML